MRPTGPTWIRPGPSRAGSGGSRAELARTHAPAFYDLVINSPTIEEFKHSVAALAEGTLGIMGADAVVFSLSGVAGYWGGFGTGLEAVYSPDFGWATYFQVGGGFVSPGAGAVLEVGFIWDMKAPSEYTGSFIEGSLSGGPGHIGYYPGTASISGFFSPEPAVQERARGVKGGGGYGFGPSVQGAVLFEWYWLLTGIESGKPDITYNEHFTFFLPALLRLGKEKGFVVQFNASNAASGLIVLKVLYQGSNRHADAPFHLPENQIFSPHLVSVGENLAEFDTDSDGETDLKIVVPPYVITRGGMLNVAVIYHGQKLLELSYPGIPMRTLPNGKEYFRIPFSEHLPDGPRYIDEDGYYVNRARP